MLILPAQADHMARFEQSYNLLTPSVPPPPPPSSPSRDPHTNATQAVLPSDAVSETPVLSSSLIPMDNISVLELDPKHSAPAAPSTEAATYAALAKCNHSHRSMTLALFSPSHVSLGAVGYYSKASGKFITLFNALSLFKLPSGLSVPSLDAYGQFRLKYLPHRNKTNQFAVPLAAGETAAYAFAKSSVYTHIDNLVVAAEWLKHHADVIIQECGSDFHITREDLSIVTGTVNALDYALFLSRDHFDGHMSFDVYRDRAAGSPWGEFNMSRLRHSAAAPVGFTSKVSKVRCRDEKGCAACGDTLLLARLGMGRPGGEGV
ncbi:hypothetical protein F5I97DRAFT_477011 [Phlebopus sp. FC_14]|nr:hypothetical protein F5I97DRAFT_477011 [Phlebopus sp. FC_14]